MVHCRSKMKTSKRRHTKGSLLVEKNDLKKDVTSPYISDLFSSKLTDVYKTSIRRLFHDIMPTGLSC